MANRIFVIPHRRLEGPQRDLRAVAELPVRAVAAAAVAQADQRRLQFLHVLALVAVLQQALAQPEHRRGRGRQQLPALHGAVVHAAVAVDIRALQAVALLPDPAPVGDEGAGPAGVALDGVHRGARHLVHDAHVADPALAGGVEVDHIPPLGLALAALDVLVALLEGIGAGGRVVGEGEDQLLRHFQPEGRHKTPVHKILAPLVVQARGLRPGLHVPVELRIVPAAGVGGLTVQVLVALLLQVSDLGLRHLDHPVDRVHRHSPLCLSSHRGIIMSQSR